MREIVPFYKEPKKPENLIDTLFSGAQIETGVINFNNYSGCVSEVKEDGEGRGTVIYLPYLSAEKLFHEVLEIPTPETKPEERGLQTALLQLKNGKVVRFAFQAIFGGIIVQAVDENGTRLSCGNLITFSSEGTVRVIPGVNPHLGFRLNLDGGIQEG